MALSPKKKRFCVEYLKDSNGAQAAIRAGYAEASARQQASRLLTNDDVKQYLKELRDEILGTEKEALKYYVLQKLKKIADAKITDVANIIDNEMEVRDTSKLSPDLQEAIEELSVTKTKGGGAVKVKMHSKTDALKQLGQFAGMFDNKIELSGKVETATSYTDKKAYLKELLDDIKSDQ